MRVAAPRSMIYVLSEFSRGLGDRPNVIAGKRAELFCSFGRSDEPAVVADVDQADDVALAQFELIGVPRTVVEQRTQSDNRRSPVVSRHLGFSKSGNLRVGVKRVNMHHHAKFRGERSNRC